MIFPFGKKARLKKLQTKFASQITRIAGQIAKGNRNEEETRRWCVDMIRGTMGYGDHDIETECTILGKRIDIALKINGNIEVIIECKAAGINLNQAAVNQAANYATSCGVEFIVVTNGHNWQMHHVSIPQKGGDPIIQQLFDVYLLDSDGVSADDAYLLYLLSKDSIKSEETMSFYHEVNSLSSIFFLKALRDKEVLMAIAKSHRKIYQQEMSYDVGAEIEGAELFVSEVEDIYQQLEQPEKKNTLRLSAK